MQNKQRKVIMINASPIVTGNDTLNNIDDAHNDILGEEMAVLIWTLIKSFTM